MPYHVPKGQLLPGICHRVVFGVSQETGKMPEGEFCHVHTHGAWGNYPLTALINYLQDLQQIRFSRVCLKIFSKEESTTSPGQTTQKFHVDVQLKSPILQLVPILSRSPRYPKTNLLFFPQDSPLGIWIRVKKLDNIHEKALNRTRLCLLTQEPQIV